jgi:hypothetical protein
VAVWRETLSAVRVFGGGRRECGENGVLGVIRERRRSLDAIMVDVLVSGQVLVSVSHYFTKENVISDF